MKYIKSPFERSFARLASKLLERRKRKLIATLKEIPGFPSAVDELREVMELLEEG